LGSSAYWLATGIAFVVSVVCSIAEGALLSYSPSRLEEQLKDPGRRQRIQGYLGQVDRYLFTSIVLNALSDVVLVFACTLGFFEGVEGKMAAVYALLTSLVVVIVFAEAIPRAFATHYSEPLIPKVLPLIAVADKILMPITYPLRALHDGIAGMLAGNEPERRAEDIKDEIRSAALEASREGVIDPQASEMIEAAIEFKDVEVHEIMTPRTDMAAIDVSTAMQEAVKIALEQGHSRIPVYEGTRDRIIGVLYAKDLLVAWGKSNGVARGAVAGPAGDAARAGADGSIRPLLRKPYFVPESKLIGELLKEFRARKVHIAIVLDEYGGTAGLVTIEDIIEEVVGEIEDEYDTGSPEELPPFKWIDEKTADVDARLHIAEVNEALSIALPDDGEYETLGGFLFFSMGKVPKKGERFSHDDADFTVLEGDERRIHRVRAQIKRKKADVTA
jgi:putative hemolysin